MALGRARIALPLGLCAQLGAARGTQHRMPAEGHRSIAGRVILAAHNAGHARLAIAALVLRVNRTDRIGNLMLVDQLARPRSCAQAVDLAGLRRDRTCGHSAPIFGVTGWLAAPAKQENV